MKYYIYWDEDYNGSDRDELLMIANSIEEKEDFIDNWCAGKACQLHYDLNDGYREFILNQFRKQLFVMNEPRYK